MEIGANAHHALAAAAFEAWGAGAVLVQTEAPDDDAAATARELLRGSQVRLIPRPRRGPARAARVLAALLEGAVPLQIVTPREHARLLRSLPAPLASALLAVAPDAPLPPLADLDLDARRAALAAHVLTGSAERISPVSEHEPRSARVQHFVRQARLLPRRVDVTERNVLGVLDRLAAIEAHLDDGITLADEARADVVGRIEELVRLVDARAATTRDATDTAIAGLGGEVRALAFDVAALRDDLPITRCCRASPTAPPATRSSLASSRRAARLRRSSPASRSSSTRAATAQASAAPCRRRSRCSTSSASRASSSSSRTSTCHPTPTTTCGSAAWRPGARSAPRGPAACRHGSRASATRWCSTPAPCPTRPASAISTRPPRRAAPRMACAPVVVRTRDGQVVRVAGVASLPPEALSLRDVAQVRELGGSVLDDLADALEHQTHALRLASRGDVVAQVPLVAGSRVAEAAPPWPTARVAASSSASRRAAAGAASSSPRVRSRIRRRGRASSSRAAEASRTSATT